MRRAGIAFGVGLLILAQAAAVVLVGRVVFVIVGAELVLLLVVAFRPQGWGRRFALGSVLVGSLIGVSGALRELSSVGGNPDYQSRLGFGVAALVLAVVAGLGGLLACRQRGRGTALLVVSAFCGVFAAYWYYINSYYLLALPFWLLGAMLFLATGP